MSTTARYNFVFVVPIRLADTPIPFDDYEIRDDSGTLLGYYTYNQYMALDGNQAMYNPTNTHFLMSAPIKALIHVANKFTAYIASVDATVSIHDGVEVDKWQDSELLQNDYLWILSCDTRAVGYGYEDFKASALLFNPVV